MVSFKARKILMEQRHRGEFQAEGGKQIDISYIYTLTPMFLCVTD